MIPNHMLANVWKWLLVLPAVGSLASPTVLADSLTPFVAGGVVDTAPKNGQGNLLDDGPFIANVSSGQYRAIVEYDVSSLPDGLVLSASLTGWVGANNSFNTGLREHLVEVYTGNGQIDLADYSVPGIEVGRFSHPSGGSTDFDFDFTGVLHNLLAAGADYIGMRISPISANMSFDVLSTSSFDPPRLHFEILPEGARTIDLLPTFDANVYNEDGLAVLKEGEYGIVVQRIDWADIDRRGILEYDISGLPANADITDAKITFDLRSYGGGAGETVDAPIYGYSGDGIAQTADAFQTSTQIGTLGPVDSLDPITIDIDHEFIESLLGTTDYFGITILGDPDYNSVSFASLEFLEPPFFIPPAQLTLTYTVPANPADFNGDGAVDGSDLQEWQTAYSAGPGGDADGDGDTDGRDFLIWQRSYAPSSLTAESLKAVPEPLSFVLLLIGTLFPVRFLRSSESRGFERLP